MANVVNFVFLGSEPIENVVTCMNYKVDKVIFFGFHETIQQQKQQTEKFLTDNCEVKKVVFLPLSQRNLPSIIKTMRGEIERELEAGNHIYFDITGGESLILVAFGMLSVEYDTPMHLYDISQNKLIELEENATKSISQDVPERSFKLDLNSYIALHGGAINHRLQKSSKNCLESDLGRYISDIWKVSQDYAMYWNSFSEFLRKNFVPEEDDNLKVCRSSQSIVSALHANNNSLTAPKILNEILDKLGEAGALLDVRHDSKGYAFRYRSEDIKQCLRDGGSVLEMYTFQQENISADDCMIGVHIDWDGVIHNKSGIDVLNEVDVLALKGNIPKFISCKSGKMDDAGEVLHALYEIETVAQRFGGKYAEKVLVTMEELKPVYRDRAAEMGIEIRTEKK